MWCLPTLTARREKGTERNPPALLDQVALLDQIYQVYEERLAQELVERDDLRAEWRRQFGHVYDDCLRSVQQGHVVLSEEKIALSSVLGVATALSEISLEALSAAWSEMFDVFLGALPQLTADQLLPSHTGRLALQSINRSIAERSRASSMWYEKALAKRFDRARMADQRRTARELHDWFGSNISLAIRKLELHNLETKNAGGRQERHIADLQSVLATLFEGTRRFSSGLRLHTPVAGIDKELRSFVDSFGFDLVDVAIFVEGDEAQAPSEILGEIFLVLRECLRNIFVHSHASEVLVMLEFSANRICGVVQDDGQGFDTSLASGSVRSGSGLLSMQERVTSLSGSFTLSSSPRHGTRIAFWIPNPGGVRERHA
jgi:signal transduction histidine kinase